VIFVIFFNDAITINFVAAAQFELSFASWAGQRGRSTFGRRESCHKPMEGKQSE